MTARKTPARKTPAAKPAKDTGPVSVTVRDGWAVYDGTEQQHGGAVATVDRDTANAWTAAGWVDPAED